MSLRALIGYFCVHNTQTTLLSHLFFPVRTIKRIDKSCIFKLQTKHFLLVGNICYLQTFLKKIRRLEQAQIAISSLWAIIMWELTCRIEYSSAPRCEERKYCLRILFEIYLETCWLCMSRIKKFRVGRIQNNLS